MLAHRGDRRAGPENSASSVLGALRDADGVEVDVLVTADGVPVLRHDERLPDGTPVRSLALRELRGRLRADGDTLPRVADVLAAADGVGRPDAIVNLELKVPGAARALRPLADRCARVAFTSFFPTEVLEAATWFPGRPAGALLDADGLPVVAPASFVVAHHRVAEVAARRHPGRACWVYTVNDPGAAARARAARASVWIGDDVDAMRRFVASTAVRR